MHRIVISLLGTACFLLAQTAQPKKSPYPHDMVWFNIPKNPPPGVVHKSYFSASMKTQVGYSIYLPPEYEKGTGRYPVIYWLHGRGGTEASNGYPLRYLPPTPIIIVYANGGSETNYCDSYDGKYMGATTIVKELIPYIDQNYRMLATREGRSLQHMSMGGFGAMRLGLKFPGLFSSLVAFAGGYRFPDEMAGAPPSYQEMYNNDVEVFRERHPETWARRNLKQIRGKMTIQMYVGKDDPGLKGNRRMHQVLTELEIPHGYEEFDGIAHNLTKLAEHVQSKNFLIALGKQ